MTDQHRDDSRLGPDGNGRRAARERLATGALARWVRACATHPWRVVFGWIGIVAVLIALIGGEDRYRRAAWYAWNPLVAYSFAGGAHFDSLMMLPMIAGVLCLTKFEGAKSQRTRWLLAVAAAALFGIAISVKLIPLLLLPAAFFALRKHAPVLAISLAIPLLLATLYGYPAVNVWEPLRRFADITRTNDLFWWVIEDTVWPNPRQRNFQYNYVILALVVIASVALARNWRRGMLWSLGIALVLSPAMHAWYCTWILPLATWRRAYAWHVLSVSLFVYFLFWNERLFALPWRAEPWMRALIIVPPVLAMILSLRERVAAAQPQSR